MDPQSESYCVLSSLNPRDIPFIAVRFLGSFLAVDTPPENLVEYLAVAVANVAHPSLTSLSAKGIGW